MFPLLPPEINSGEFRQRTRTASFIQDARECMAIAAALSKLVADTPPLELPEVELLRPDQLVRRGLGRFGSDPPVQLVGRLKDPVSVAPKRDTIRICA